MSQRSIRQITLLIGTLLIAIGSALRGLPDQGASITPANPFIPLAVSSSDQFYPVTKVVDGDTLRVRIGSKVETVRLIGLDTPEIVDPRRQVQCFGKEASDEAKKILTGQYVRLETDASQSIRDKYGRLLAYAFVNANSDPKGILVNKYMIAEGFGHEYTYNLPYKYQKEFKAAEKQAREEQKGLWAPGMCGL